MSDSPNNRNNWQTVSNKRADEAETVFESAIRSSLDATYPGLFLVERFPSEFQSIYSDHQLPEEVQSSIYTPDDIDQSRWGIRMDFAIRSLLTGRTLFGEIKRQDGWTEETSSAAGRGNAHERCCKYFAPGLLKAIRKKSQIFDDILPFWVVFTGNITKDPRRNREIDFWFQGYEGNYFMWRDMPETTKLLHHFQTYLLPALL